MVEAPAEFDAFAETYERIHRQNIRLSGEDPEYFARSKVEILRRAWYKQREQAPNTILDFGCGVGASLPHFRALFPDARLLGVDVSGRSLAVAEARGLSNTDFLCYDGNDIDIPPASQDLIFSACVFHHIDPAARQGLIRQLRALLRPEGALVIYEHNPVNPVTRYIVATCPFDREAVLLPACELIALQRNAGFERVRTTFTGFFPRHLSALRRFEPWLACVPFGAQYFTFATP